MTELLRRLFQQLLRVTKGNKPLRIAYPLIEATDTFFFGKDSVTGNAPHVREYMDLKRFMSLVMLFLAPCALWGIYSFGWRVLALIIISYAFGVGAEAVFAGIKKEEINEGAFVSCLLYPLILPPNTPFWIAAVGIVFGLVFGKEVFGGTGQNVFNPALVGRCFVYISFPGELTGKVWSQPFTGALGGFTEWKQPIDAITSATPTTLLKGTEAASSADIPSAWDLLFGLTSGCPGETLRIWIIVAALALSFMKVASFTIIFSTCLGAFLTASIGHAVSSSPEAWPTGLMGVLGGGLLFGAVFMATDPVSSPRATVSRWIHGLGIGAISILIWVLSGYPQGVMFAILFMNCFSPVIDYFAIRHRYPAKGVST